MATEFVVQDNKCGQPFLYMRYIYDVINFSSVQEKGSKNQQWQKKVRLCPLPNTDHQPMSYMYYIMTGIGRAMFVVLSAVHMASQNVITHMD